VKEEIPAPSGNGLEGKNRMLWWTLRKLDSSNPSVRIDGIKRIKEFHDPRVLDHLMKALGDRSDEVQRAAVDALVEARNPAVPQRIREDWRRLDHTPWAVGSYVRILSRYGSTPALIAALDLDCKGFYDDVAKAIETELMALGNVGVRVLAKAVTDKHATVTVRGFAASALGRAKTAIAVPSLIEALNDPNRRVRGNAARALAEIGDQQAVVPLLTVLDSCFQTPPQRGDGPVDTSGGAVDFQSALESLVDSRSVELLLPTLNNVHAGMRYSAARLLGKIGDVQAVDTLIYALNDGSSDVRFAVVLALEAIGDIRAVEPLCAALADSDHNVRRVAASALGSFADSRAAIALARFLLSLPVECKHVTDIEIQKACWAALASLRHPLTVGPLVQRANSDTRRSRDAIAILTQIFVNSAVSVSPDDVRAVAGLNDLWYEYSIPSDEFNVTKREKVDCSELRQMAHREMSRRGLA
jgi:HEAT repeat protein